ncbi:hypothetical protein BABINDRAFT_180028 [Babjeviella inositovora NRRL Y-12698]|uniref:ADP/ATP translocase n=1 Tax=Babjeviella inositovora NRRL Y-12698 TaxID=984486 RepID=A0A1E3QV12_9ASCO|nr:uncharacterized protein BABINDRAFT_180028 [Babjeviella inositovora NRRL Y-12698]ODQ80797.1 hypothetical protein BABINDRAFT_180028 [Babjeviella inositovora NRRL Y-12698]
MSTTDGITKFIIDFFIGGVSAAVSKTAGAPIERVRLLIQNQNEMIKQGRLSRKYDGIIECFKRTSAEEGFGSFWRGNTATVIRCFAILALNFAFMDKFKAMFGFKKSEGYWPYGLAGATSLAFVYSLDFARTRLATDVKSRDGGARQFNGLLDVYKQIFTSDGIAGFYRGFGPSVIGIIVYRGLYLGLYDSLKPVVLVGPLEGSFLASFLLGWTVTTTASTASYPLDTIRRRMMMTSGQAVKYAGAFDCFKKIVAIEGVKSLFKGCSINILIGICGAGVIFIYYQLQAFVFGQRS